MKNKLSLLSIVVLTLTFSAADAQKMLAEGTVTYDITVLEATNKEAAEKAFRGASQVLYVKGPKARYEFISPLRSQAIIYDASTKTAVLLRETGLGERSRELHEFLLEPTRAMLPKMKRGSVMFHWLL